MTYIPVAKGDRTPGAWPAAGEGQLRLDSLEWRTVLKGGGVVTKEAAGGLPSGRQVEILGQGHQGQ